MVPGPVPSLDALSTEVLLKIFKYLDVYDLCKLKQTCRRFNEIIETWATSFIKNVRLLVTNQIHPVVCNRSARILSPFERLRVSRNWRAGVYNEKAFLYNRVRYIPWLQLEKDLLWLSRGGSVRAYKRNNSGFNPRHIVYDVKTNVNAEICRFILKDNLLLSGQTNGSLWLWSLDAKKFIINKENCHEGDVDAVDLCDSLLVSGSRDNYVKIWRNPVENNDDIQCDSICLRDRVWSVALSENNSLLAVGTAGNAFTESLTVFDVNKQNFVAKLGTGRFGAGILDINWESPSVLWTCGYDTCLRRWDLRSGCCEQSFEDPCGATVYCFQYDHFNTLISGTQDNGRAVLWDIRQKNIVQMYFMDSCRRREKSSPVYGLSFDAEFLFTATDQHVNVLDFSVSKGKLRDYSNLFLRMIKV